jgi:hypothetical protein
MAQSFSFQQILTHEQCYSAFGYYVFEDKKALQHILVTHFLSPIPSPVRQRPKLVS